MEQCTLRSLTNWVFRPRTILFCKSSRTFNTGILCLWKSENLKVYTFECKFILTKLLMSHVTRHNDTLITGVWWRSAINRDGVTGANRLKEKEKAVFDVRWPCFARHHFSYFMNIFNIVNRIKYDSQIVNKWCMFHWKICIFSMHLSGYNNVPFVFDINFRYTNILYKTS